MRFPCVMFFAAVAPLLMGAAQAVRLQPSTRWVLEYAENSCRLSRSFGSGENETVLRFESDAPEDLDMVVFGRPVADRGDQVQLPFGKMDEGIPVRFSPVGGKLMHGRAARSASGRPAVLVTAVWLYAEAEANALETDGRQRDAAQTTRPPALDPAEVTQRRSDRLAFASATSELQIDPRGHPPVILETGSLKSPIEALDQCSRQSLRDWGVNPDTEDRVVRPAWAPNRSSWVTADDYPVKMLDDDQESTVSARVLIDASGQVTRCTSLSHFKLPQFNELVCDRIKKLAHFQPAELADGTKVPSYYIVRFIFRIAG